jgi:hypothetical protein
VEEEFLAVPVREVEGRRGPGRGIGRICRAAAYS